jgi:glycosyltransferase involved in cell wall biosynthesis
MRIAIDARELTGHPTGVGRYLSEILTAWSQLPAASDHEFVLCAPEPVTVPAPLAASGHAARSLRVTSLTESGRGTLWEQRALPRLVSQARADVLFAPAYTAPVRCPAPVVLTIHDVSFAAHPEWFTRREGFRRRLLARISARRAARVVTESEFSKREIVRLLGVDPVRIDVIYLGASAAPAPADRDPLVLYVGSIFNRRHLPALIDGFARVAARHPTLRLEIVGDNRTYPHIDLNETIARTGVADRIRVRQYVSDSDLASLYARASAFAFLSEYEGFGLTPMEAMAAGIPIVVLDTEVAREIYGPAAEFVARPEGSLVAQALERVIADGATAARLRDAGHVRIARYSWPDCAARTLQVLLTAGTGP